jgi:hypothetical protein
MCYYRALMIQHISLFYLRSQLFYEAVHRTKMYTQLASALTFTPFHQLIIDFWLICTYIPECISLKGWRIAKTIYWSFPILVSESDYDFIVICSLVFVHQNNIFYLIICSRSSVSSKRRRCRGVFEELSQGQVRYQVELGSSTVTTVQVIQDDTK